ncbi:uncharacterized protein LOC110706192 [Chenopodium quinoa]|uniref:uncharacterized protein LOC110706192 n=1 Tax=Chenopodium quinoa TaxID=63459 RepID=UPI000B786560|nr:uncharacterized protein LOC110706192 [Chenopodium quinoa]
MVANYGKGGHGRIWLIWKPGVFCVDVISVEMQDRIGAPVTLTEIENFGNCVRHSNLSEIKTDGLFFTWNNKQRGVGRVCSRIDRVFGNGAWLDTFQHTNAIFLPEGLMDHCPCVINVLGSVGNTKKPFKFFNIWTEHPGFFRIIEDNWTCSIQGTPVFIVVKKLRLIKEALKGFNKQHFSSVLTDDACLEEDMLKVKGNLNSDPTDESLMEQEHEIRSWYVIAHARKLQFLRQKAKLHWLKDGDVNSSFFHACLRKRRVKNSV